MSFTKELTQALMGLAVERKYSTGGLGTYKSSVINKDHEPLIESVVIEKCEEVSKRIAELETKIRMYEIVMGNSNFKPTFEPVFEPTHESNFIDPWDIDDWSEVKE